MPFISPISRYFGCWCVRWGIGLCGERILIREKSGKVEKFCKKECNKFGSWGT